MLAQAKFIAKGNTATFQAILLGRRPRFTGAVGCLYEHHAILGRHMELPTPILNYLPVQHIFVFLDQTFLDSPMAYEEREGENRIP